MGFAPQGSSETNRKLREVVAKAGLGDENAIATLRGFAIRVAESAPLDSLLVLGKALIEIGEGS